MPDASQKQLLESLHSSYKTHHYGELIYALVRTHRPETCIEIGSLEGYSAGYIGLALKENGRGRLMAFDLWENYEFRHSPKDATRATLDALGLQREVALYTRDAFAVAPQCETLSIDLLHIDISNNGANLSQLIDDFHSKLKPGALLLLEGGSPERDEIEWMQKFKKPGIASMLKQHPILQKHYSIVTFTPFPSLTVCRKLPES